MVAVERLRGTRGRPSVPGHSVADMLSITYLASISRKFGIDVAKFFECIHKAWVQGKSSLDCISIKQRQIMKDGCVFLITKNERVVAQLKLSPKVLEHLRKADVSSFRFESRPAAKQNKLKPDDLEIKDLSSEIKRFNLKARVTEKPMPRTVFSKFGEALLVSTATIADRSGKIGLTLWNDQIGLISVGDLLHIENAQLKKFRGKLQVRVGKYTKLRVIENEQGFVNKQSLI